MLRRTAYALEYKYRWDLGEYKVGGVIHADYAGVTRDTRAANASSATIGYKKYRDRLEAIHAPFATKMGAGAAESSGAWNKVLLGQHSGMFNPKTVEPRKMTREELEEAEIQYMRSRAFQMYEASMPTSQFYLENNWKSRYSRAFKRQQAEEEVKEIIERSLPGKGGLVTKVRDARRQALQQYEEMLKLESSN
eukprot:TRINITY_DN9596_c0_g1_i1.p1 TRINITY_DN9596_c0_g1~~TRINITY_DN9596_c0_g1_i1.p1  ORF type:complete len:193 (+),score=24.89 TRINITY_DN9596_c0_g1_i1:102-680(+)